MVSTWVPIGYLAFLFSSLFIFSKIYRNRQLQKPAPAPWFPPHKSRNIYISLLSLTPLPPRPILIAALLQRAVEDVKLIWSIRDSKQALTTLLSKGQIGDQLWERFMAAEKELEAEILEVVEEANTWLEGYGQQIFTVASEMANHEKWKKVWEEIDEDRKATTARLANPLPSSLVLSPLTYLTPSSLTVQPSNPMSLLPSSPLLPVLEVTGTTTTLSLPPPAPEDKLPTAPPSRSPSPMPPALVGTEENAEKKEGETNGKSVGEVVTPGKAKKGKKKKPVKGGK